MCAVCRHFFIPQSCCLFLLNRTQPSFGASPGCRPSPEIPLWARGGMIRRQARFLGKPVHAPTTQNTGTILWKGPERDEFSDAAHGINSSSTISADAEGLELAMQGGALHAYEFSGARDIARKTADLGDQVIALEHFPRQSSVRRTSPPGLIWLPRRRMANGKFRRQ